MRTNPGKLGHKLVWSPYLHPRGVWTVRISWPDHSTLVSNADQSSDTMLKSSISLLLLVALAATQHHQRYDNFNADLIIQNERVLLAYYKCVMDKGPCTKDGKHFKKVLPETLTTACDRCTPKQKVIVRKLLLGIRAKSEPRFMELLDKYDPHHSNRQALYNFLINGNEYL
ncbi:Ejaculatory bulb-specific protein 3 [Eumeta japonica]|uniref:Ejaculatory bulb-specific protein 3 n=1 Tax=Eumeta variegata TaxID=151549 RepID=A0A4C1T0W5_EUMVA|nr:Ejaculatory bulb-specific protein 3 [Eumeta japonica]